LEKLPEGADHVPEVALPPTEPAKVIVPPAQTVCADPAVAVAIGLTVMVTIEVAPTHGPAPSGSAEVKVNTTIPVAMEGVYVEFNTDAFEKVPEEALQVPVLAPPVTVPASVIVPPAQTVCAAPAFAVAAWLTVMITVEIPAAHGPAPSGSLDVNVSVTVPLFIDGV
jgi:hypothetical protein